MHPVRFEDFHHNNLWQFISERDYSNTECMLVATGFTPLFTNLESMAAKPRADGGKKIFKLIDKYLEGLHLRKGTVDTYLELASSEIQVDPVNSRGDNSVKY